MSLTKVRLTADKAKRKKACLIYRIACYNMERDGNKSPSFLGVYRPRGRASHVGHPQTNIRLFRTKLTKVIGSNYVGAEVQPRSSFSYVDAFLKAYYVSNQASPRL